MQFQYSEEFSSSLITVTYIYFLFNTSTIFKATEESLQYSLHPAWS